MSVAVVDFYLERRRIRAEVPLGGFSRASDMLNSVRTGLLAAVVRLSTSGQTAVQEQNLATSDLVIRLDDVRLVCPIQEPLPGPEAAAARVERQRVRVTLETGEWQVTGDLHLADRVRWIDFLAAMSGRFLPVSRATVRSSGIAPPVDYDFLLVNAARISALYELTPGGPEPG